MHACMYACVIDGRCNAHIQYTYTVNLCLCLYLYNVNRMIPVPDVSIGLLLEFVCALFQRFKQALQSGAQSFPVAWGLEPTWRWHAIP